MTRQRKPLSRALRFAVLAAAGFRCQYCGQTAPAVVLHVDHVIPVTAGGTDDRSNLVAACSSCNDGKGTIRIQPGRCAGERHAGPPEGPFPYPVPATQPLVAWICPTCRHVLATAVAA